MISKEQRNGGGNSTQQVEYQTDGGGQQSSPDVDTTLSGGSEPESSTSSAPTQQQAVWPGNQSVAPSIPSTQSILGPLLQPNAVPMLQQAVRSGQARLNAELHRFYGSQRQASAASMGMRGFHFMLQPLLGIAEAIGRDAALKGEVKRLGLGGRLSRASSAKVVEVIGETRPRGVGVKALENVLIWPFTQQNPRMVGPMGINANPNTATIAGTIYLEFDSDYFFDPRFPRNVQEAAAAMAAQNAINGLLGAQQLNGIPVVSNIVVTVVPQANRPPAGAHVYKIGNGASDPKWLSEANNYPNPSISWATKRGKEGYLYNPTDADHETMHWLGLEDRYTEVVVLDGGSTTGTQELPTADWGRPLGRSLPLANLNPQQEAMDYDPLTNVMSVRGLTLTQFQLQIISSASRVEQKYARDVVAVGPYVEDRTIEHSTSSIVEQAIEFQGHHATWWLVVAGNPLANRPKLPNEYIREPSTFRRIGYTYFGQNFHAVRRAVYDRDHHQDFDNWSPRMLAIGQQPNSGNRFEINKAISHNQ